MTDRRHPRQRGSKPKVLFVTTVVPIPVNAGNKQRTDQSIKALIAAGADVTILVHTRANRKATIETLEENYPACRILVVGKAATAKVHFKKKRYGRALLKVLNKYIDRLTHRHLLISNATECPPHFLRVIRREMREHDVYFSNYAKVTPIWNFRFDGISVCDTHDLQSRRQKIFLAREEPNAIARYIKGWIFEWSEKIALRKFDHLLSISDVELPEMRAMVGAGVAVRYAPATFDISSCRESALDQPFDIGFIGTRSKPNIDGIVWFLDEILPSIVEAKPDVRVLIVGRVVTADEVAAAIVRHSSRVQVIEFVNKVESAYSQAKVWICPVRFGTGMKIKAVEGLAMGVAMVGTSAAFESIAVRDEADVMIADDAVSFRDKTLRLVRDPHLAGSLRNNAQQVFLRDHSFMSHVRILKELIDSI